MSSKKEEKAQVAADRIKAAALTAAKGLSRAQAERAATAAARNVNAYGQKEEGPSRWQEKREAKRQMYLMSTEKAVKLGVRKEVKPTMSTIGGNAQCQKCYGTDHWTYECKGERVYISRPSRTLQLKNPKLRVKVSEVTMESDMNYNSRHNASHDAREEKDIPSSKKTKRKHRSAPGSDSEDSVFETDSGSGSSSVTGSDYSSESSSGSSSSSDSEEERRRRKRKSLKKKKSKGKSRRYSTSSESSDSDSGSDSDSDDKSSKKKKRHSRRR